MTAEGRRSLRDWSLLAGVVLAGLVAALLLPGFALFQLTMAVAYGLAIFGVGFLFRHSGQLSLGHAGFVAIGAYTTAVMMRAGVPFWLSAGTAALAAFAVGWAIGRLVWRLSGAHLAVATFGLAAVMPRLFKAAPLLPWTGGGRGISVPRPPPPFDSDQGVFALALATAVLSAAAIRLWLAGNRGRALRAARDEPAAAGAVGIDVARLKALAFGVSAVPASLAGALIAVAAGYVAPDGFAITMAISLFVGVVVSGAGPFPAALAGGLFVVYVPNVAEGVSKGLAWAVFGVILLGVVYARPLLNAARVAGGRLLRPPPARTTPADEGLRARNIRPVPIDAASP